MMEVQGPRGSGDTGLLDTPLSAHKTNKPKFISHHTRCSCDQPNTCSNKHNVNTTGISRIDNTHTLDDILTHTLYTTHTTQEALDEERNNITFDKNAGNNPERPRDIIPVTELKDIRAFHDRFLHQVDLYRFILYRIDFAQSPHRAEDRTSNDSWMEHYGMKEIRRLERVVYELLRTALQDFAPTRYLFIRHQADHYLCASKVWFSFRHQFKHQLGGRQVDNGANQNQTPPTQSWGKEASTQASRARKPTRTHRVHTRPRQHTHLQDRKQTRHTTHSHTCKYNRDTSHTKTPALTNTTYTNIYENTLGLQSKPKFKGTVVRLNERPTSDHRKREALPHTHRYTHHFTQKKTHPIPLPRPFFPNGNDETGQRVKQSDEVITDLTHPQGSIELHEGHPKNNTRTRQWSYKSTKKLRWPPTKRATETQTTGPILIDARVLKKERLAPIHFIRYSPSTPRTKRKLNWWNLAIQTHRTKIRLSRRWTYILNRRKHRQLTQPRDIWTRQVNRVHTTYVVEYTHEGIQGHTTLLPSLTKVIQGQVNNTDLTILTQPNSTAADMTKAIGQHFSRDTSSFYLTADHVPLAQSETIHPRKHIRVIPRLRGEMKRQSTRPPALDFGGELAEVRNILQRTIDLQTPHTAMTLE